MSRKRSLPKEWSDDVKNQEHPLSKTAKKSYEVEKNTLDINAGAEHSETKSSEFCSNSLSSTQCSNEVVINTIKNDLITLNYVNGNSLKTSELEIDIVDPSLQKCPEKADFEISRNDSFTMQTLVNHEANQSLTISKSIPNCYALLKERILKKLDTYSLDRNERFSVSNTLYPSRHFSPSCSNSKSDCDGQIILGQVRNRIISCLNNMQTCTKVRISKNDITIPFSTEAVGATQANDTSSNDSKVESTSLGLSLTDGKSKILLKQPINDESSILFTRPTLTHSNISNSESDIKANIFNIPNCLNNIYGVKLDMTVDRTEKNDSSIIELSLSYPNDEKTEVLKDISSEFKSVSNVTDWDKLNNTHCHENSFMDISNGSFCENSMQETSSFQSPEYFRHIRYLDKTINAIPNDTGIMDNNSNEIQSDVSRAKVSTNFNDSLTEVTKSRSDDISLIDISSGSFCGNSKSETSILSPKYVCHVRYLGKTDKTVPLVNCPIQLFVSSPANVMSSDIASASKSIIPTQGIEKTTFNEVKSNESISNSDLPTAFSDDENSRVDVIKRQISCRLSQIPLPDASVNLSENEGKKVEAHDAKFTPPGDSNAGRVFEPDIVVNDTIYNASHRTGEVTTHTNKLPSTGDNSRKNFEPAKTCILSQNPLSHAIGSIIPHKTFLLTEHELKKKQEDEPICTASISTKIISSDTIKLPECSKYTETLPAVIDKQDIVDAFHGSNEARVNVSLSEETGTLTEVSENLSVSKQHSKDQNKITPNSDSNNDFVSTDKDENVDNFDPRWAELRNVSSDSERYRKVRERWRNLGVPNPNRDLSFMHRKTPSQPRRETLKIIQGARQRQRTRSCTASFEDYIREIRREQSRNLQLLDSQQNFEIEHIRQRYNTINPYDIFNFDFQYYTQQEVRSVIDSYDWKREHLCRETEENIRKYQTYMTEVNSFQSFYQGIATTEDTTVLTPEQSQLLQDTERMYNEYHKFYRH